MERLQHDVPDCTAGRRCPFHGLGFMSAMRTLRSYAETVESKQERALVLKDIEVWQRHWDSYLRSESRAKQSLTNLLSQVA